jgi:hypothetical protein
LAAFRREVLPRPDAGERAVFMTGPASRGELPHPTPTQRVSRLHIAGGVAISALFLILAVRGASLSGVRDAMRATRPLPIVIGMSIGLATCVVMGLRWRAVIQTTTPMSVKDAIDQVTIANLASLVMPARFGDVARVLLVQTIRQCQHWYRNQSTADAEQATYATEQCPQEQVCGELKHGYAKVNAMQK